MENKTMYYNAFKSNDGQLNEIELGESLGIDAVETGEILAHLLTEGKIQFKENRFCQYSLNRGNGHNSRRYSRH